MLKTLEINRTKIRSGCQSGGKVVAHNSKSDLPLTCREVMDGGCFMLACQSPFVVLALVRIIGLDMTYVVAGELIDGTLNFWQSVFLAHFQR